MENTSHPTCPRCGDTMIVQRAHLGPRAGTPYWFCTRATCLGSLPFDATGSMPETIAESA
jgi:hypothetical protein